MGFVVSFGGDGMVLKGRREVCRVAMSMEVRTFGFMGREEEVDGLEEGTEVRMKKWQRVGLTRLLQGVRFKRLVAKDSRCAFVRFTGVVFRRCELSEEFNQGLSPRYIRYENDVNYSIVDVPPIFLERAQIVPDKNRVCAVFERFGIPLEELVIEQEITTAAIHEEEKQYERWADQGETWRTETDANDVHGTKELYDEDFSSFDCD